MAQKLSLEEELKNLATIAKEKEWLLAENFIQCVLATTWIKNDFRCNEDIDKEATKQFKNLVDNAGFCGINRE